MGALDRFANWFWRTHRHHYFAALFVLVVIALSTTLLIPLGLVFGPAWDLSVSQTVQWSALALLTGVLTGAMGVIANPDIRRPIRAWIAGDHSDPRLVRDMTMVLAERFAMRGALLGAPLMLGVAAPVLAHMAGFTRLGYVAVEVLGAIGLALAAFLMANGLEILNRPLLLETAAELPGDLTTHDRTWGLRATFTMSTMITAAGAAGIAGGLAHFFGTTTQDAAAAGVLTGVIFGAYGTFVNYFFLVQPSFRPLTDIMRATERVRGGDFSQLLPVTSADEFGDLSVALNQMMVGLAQREALHSAFGSYVDPVLAQRLLDENTSVFAGENVEVTVFFADVRGFTAYASEVEPEEAVARLNRLFDIMVPAIRTAGGYPNRYMGDGLLAVFGTPEPLPNHPNRALAAAVTIQREIRKAFGDEVRLGIGINSGKVIAGTIGGGGKLDFTVIGDAVNVAARVEEHTKVTGDAILLTAETLAMVRAPAQAIVDRGEQQLRGHDKAVHLYAIEI